MGVAVLGVASTLATSTVFFRPIPGGPRGMLQKQSACGDRVHVCVCVCTRVCGEGDACAHVVVTWLCTCFVLVQQRGPWYLADLF